MKCFCPGLKYILTCQVHLHSCFRDLKHQNSNHRIMPLMNREGNGVSATLPQALTYFSSSSSTAADHWWWLLRPRHERTAGRVWDGARQAALLGRLRQNDLRHRLRLQEPLAGLRGHKERTHQEGKGPEYWTMQRWPRFGFSLSEFGARAGNWELLAIPGRIVVVGQIDFQAIQLSRRYLKEEELRVCVCVCA